MPVVGFHQARRPRQTPAAKLRREFSWPRPGGIGVSIAGASLIFSGALVLAPVGESAPVPVAAATSQPGTTPDTSLAATEPSPVGPEPASTATPSDKGTFSASGNSAAPIPAPTAPPVAGAGADGPIQDLFAAGNGSPSDATLWDIQNPNSPLVLVNKQHLLTPVDYAPTDLATPAVRSGSGEPILVRAEAASAIERMFAAAAAEGINITVKSSYRSFQTQVAVYSGYVESKGESAADSTSARPGYSEHQTGLAIDIGDADAGTTCDFNPCFSTTPAGQWVAAHASEYGFTVRYVAGHEATTGYLAEPWHLRYLGISVTTDMNKHNIHSYEDYLGLPGAPAYK